MTFHLFLNSAFIFVVTSACTTSYSAPTDNASLPELTTSDNKSQENLSVQTAPNLNEYRIGPADVLQIAVWKNEALSYTVPVRSDGMISFPLVNEIRAAGLTPLELRDVVRKKLMAYMPNPEVSVMVMETLSFMVSVLGEVKKPDRYQFNSQVTVLDVLARSGGITEFASTSNLFILRSQGSSVKRIPFNYSKFIATSGGSGNFYVQPGDIIVVP